MSGIAHSLVRRGIDATQQHYNSPQGQNDDSIKQIAVWGMVLLWVTGVLYLAMVSAVSQPASWESMRLDTDPAFLDLLHLRRCYCDTYHD